jgi:hypothetical protein
MAAKRPIVGWFGITQNPRRVLKLPFVPRDTRTGGVLEQMILPALDRGGYQHREQVSIGDRLGCGRHVVDVVAERDSRQFLISVKWQQVSGTAEQKVPFEAICLLDAIDRGPYAKAYIVLARGRGMETARVLRTRGARSLPRDREPSRDRHP